jgi:hypothetical protein
MSWLFSQALVEAFSLPNSAEIPQCAQLNVMPTLHPFWRNVKPMEPSRSSQFGLTCGVLTGALGEELLTAFLAAFPARTSASPTQMQKDLREPGRDSGGNTPGSFGRLSPDGSEWRTVQCSLLEDSGESLQILPRSGSMRNGRLYQRPTLAHHTFGSGYGSLLPTLTVCGNYNRKGASATSGDGLATVLKMLPTLVARDYRHPGRSRLERTGSKAGDCLPQVIGGPLNPDWCEWFMGWPIGWTELKPLATDKFQQWQQQHGAFSVDCMNSTATEA